MKNQSYEKLERSLRALSEEAPEPSHYPKTMAMVRERIEQRNPIMIAIKQGAIISGVVAAIFLAMLFIPVSYSVTIGSMATALFPFTNDEDIMAVMDATQDIPNVINANFTIDNGEAKLTLISNGRNSKQLTRDLKEGLAGLISADQLSVTGEDVKQLRGGNALAAVTGGRIVLGGLYADDMSDEQIEAEIMSQLSSQGLIPRQVTVQTDRSGDGEIRREVRVEVEAPEGMEVPDGGHVIKKAIRRGDGNVQGEEKEIICEIETE
ncbi:hypothetical protein ACFLQV_04675 [Calditrichota bacterium]